MSFYEMWSYIILAVWVGGGFFTATLIVYSLMKRSISRMIKEELRRLNERQKK